MNHGKVSKDIAAGLAVLRKRIEAAKIPSSKIDESFNLATWNVTVRRGTCLRIAASLRCFAQEVTHGSRTSVLGEIGA